MKIRKNHLALLAGIMLLPLVAACNDDDISSLPEVNQDNLAGIWSACFNIGNDARQILNIDGYGKVTLTMIGYASTGATCTTVTSGPSVNPGTYTLGGNVGATLAGGTVTARIWDYTVAGSNNFSIVYVDFGANPNHLYAGDPPGSTPGTRPTAFLPFPYVRQ